METEWNPTLAPSRAIEGRVVDERGLGLADWSVRLHDLDPAEDIRQQRDFLRHWTDEVRTDRHGSFSLQRLSHSGGHHLSVWAPGAPWHGRPAVIARDVAAGIRDLDLRVTDEARATGTVRGRVVCAADGGSLEVKLIVRELGASMGFYVALAADGGFELEQVAPGRYGLELLVSEVASVARLEVVVGANEAVELGDLRVPDVGRMRIALACPDTPLRGTFSWNLLCRSTGKRGVMRNGAPPETTTLPGGEYELSIEASRYFAVPVAFHIVPNGETAVEVTLEPATLATFRFVAADGVALEYPLQVVVLDYVSGLELVRREVASEGPVVLDTVDPVVCRIEATDANGRRGKRTLSPSRGPIQPPGRVFDVELRE